MLETQDQFESLWFQNNDSKHKKDVRDLDQAFLVYFTAAWCKPCQKIDIEAVVQHAKSKRLTLWKCDETVNSYSSGYANVRKFPTFVLYTPKKEHGRLQSSDTTTILEWIDSFSENLTPVLESRVTETQQQQ